MTRPKKTDVTAAELMASLSTDEEYQQRVAERRRVVQARVQRDRESEAPIVADLQRAGFRVDSVWDLLNGSESYTLAHPILLEHLQRGGYTSMIMNVLGRSLALPESIQYWEVLRDLYLQTDDRTVMGEASGLAVALDACATPAQFEDVADLLRDKSRGESRISLLKTALRIGGQAGWELVRDLVEDVALRKEARVLLRRGRPPIDM